MVNKVDASEAVNALIDGVLDTKLACRDAKPDDFLKAAKALQESMPKIQVSEVDAQKVAMQEALTLLVLTHEFLVTFLPAFVKLVNTVYENTDSDISDGHETTH